MSEVLDLFHGYESPEHAKTAYEDNGYLILKDFFPLSTIERLKNQALDLWNEPRNEKLVIDFGAGALAGRRMLLKDAPASGRAVNHKINDLHLESDAFRSIILDPPLADFLGTLLDGRPSAINTLHFTLGSTQRPHFDTWYMPPGEEDRMAVAAIPLEPYTEKNGPLFYYPRSHLIPKYRFSTGHIRAIESEMPACDTYLFAELEKRGLEKKVFLGQPGDLFIWHSQLLHGGMPVLDPTRTRRSIVVHYWRKGDVDHDPQYVWMRDLEIPSHGGYYIARAHQACGSVIAEEPLPAAEIFSPAFLRTMGFDTEAYLDLNPDLRPVGFSPDQLVVHYANDGIREGRPAQLRHDPWDVVNTCAALPEETKRAFIRSLAWGRWLGLDRRASDPDGIMALLATRQAFEPLLVIGDSHSIFYSNLGFVGDVLPIPCVCAGGSARALIDPDAADGHGRRIIALLARLAAFPARLEKPRVLLQFGQNDMEFLYHFLRFQPGAPARFNPLDHHVFLKETAARLMAYVIQLRARFPQALFAVAGIFPPTLDDASVARGLANAYLTKLHSTKPDEASRPFLPHIEIPDQRQRTFFHHLFNAELKRLADAHDIVFVDAFDRLVNAEGVVDSVHQSNGAEHHLNFGVQMTRTVARSLIETLMGSAFKEKR